ncbi:hypothetical protein AtNW77_Chr1g0040561 [Arabidopsis thaliana]
MMCVLAAPSDGDPSLTSSNVAAISENGHRSSEGYKPCFIVVSFSRCLHYINISIYLFLLVATTNISSPLTSSSQGGSVGNGDDWSEAAMRADIYILSSDGPTQHTNSMSSYNDSLTNRNVDEKCEGDKSVDRDVSLSEVLDFFLSYLWGRHSFERTLRMVKVGENVRNQFDITKKLKQRSLVMHGFPVAL